MAARELPYLRQYAAIQNIIDYGRGLAANVVGQPGTLYRLTSASNGDVLSSANAVYNNFPLLRRVVSSADSVESRGVEEALLFELVCDLNLVTVGDIWIQTDPRYGVGAEIAAYSTNEFIGIAVAMHAVMRKAIGIQLHRTASVYRMMRGVDLNGYAQAFQQQASSLQIVNGSAVFVSSGVPAAIPIGMAPRTGGFEGPIHPKIESLPEAPQYHIYVPPIGGYAPIEGDILQLVGGARFSVMSSWHMDVGLLGNMVIARKVNPQQGNAGDF